MLFCNFTLISTMTIVNNNNNSNNNNNNNNSNNNNNNNAFNLLHSLIKYLGGQFEEMWRS